MLSAVIVLFFAGTYGSFIFCVWNCSLQEFCQGWWHSVNWYFSINQSSLFSQGLCFYNSLFSDEIVLLCSHWLLFSVFKQAPAFTLGICCYRHSLRVWSQARPQQKETWLAPGCACMCIFVSRHATESTSSLLLFVSVDPRVNQSSSESKTQNRGD